MFLILKKPEWQPNIKLAMRDFWEKTYRPSADIVQHSPEPVANEESGFVQWWQMMKGQGADGSDKLDRYLGEPLH